jgi:hypothetical protein
MFFRPKNKLDKMGNWDGSSEVSSCPDDKLQGERSGGPEQLLKSLKLRMAVSSAGQEMSIHDMDLDTKHCCAVAGSRWTSA